jgi:putative acetyltransferase
MSPSLKAPPVVRAEQPEDAAAIRHVNEAAFEGTIEADIVDNLRAAAAITLSMVATTPPAGSDEGEGAVIAHALFSPVTIGTGDPAACAVGLGPVAVLPGWQGQGVGTLLVEASLEILRTAGHTAVVVVGHPGFYSRFGFLPATRWGLTLDLEVPEEAFMALELRAGSLAGTSGEVLYRPEFGED